jgi:hypothetical protein
LGKAGDGVFLTLATFFSADIPDAASNKPAQHKVMYLMATAFGYTPCLHKKKGSWLVLASVASFLNNGAGKGFGYPNWPFLSLAPSSLASGYRASAVPV